MSDQPANSASTQRGEFRWQAFFRNSAEPLFVLNRQRRILFVNAAWEERTGVSAAQARGLICTRRLVPEPGAWQELAQCLCPTPDALAGKTSRTRRSYHAANGPCHVWDIEFFPLQGAEGLIGIIGRIIPVKTPAETAAAALPEKLMALRASWAQRFRLEPMPATTPTLRRVVEQTRLAGATSGPLLLRGERGTGKLWLARAIHYRSVAAEQSFAAVPCAALPPAVLADVLFGNDGLLTSERAGTVYLKDVAHLPRELQARVCDRPAATPRLIAGCRADPEQEVQAGRLLDDLYATVSTLTISLPPLRERSADLPRWIEHFLERTQEEGEKKVTSLTSAAWEIVRAYPWPGNLTELNDVLRKACRRASGAHIDVAHLPAYLRQAAALAQVPAAEAARVLNLPQILEQVERRLIQAALKAARGNKSRAAESLSVWRPRLLRRMEALGIKDKDAEDRPAAE